MAVKIDKLSTVSVSLEMYFEKERLSLATGFLMARNDKLFLVTNKHVLSGRDSITEECLSKKTGAIPNKCSVWFHLKGDENNLGKWKRYDMTLKKWFCHPNNSKIDVGVIHLPNELPGISLFHFTDDLADEDLLVLPGMPVAIVGYPGGKSVDGKFPFWKGGTVACDFDLEPDNLPFFYIDATTKEGMSGSPVYLFHDGISIGANQTMKLSTRKVKFLGVYAGRDVAAGEDKIEIGRVWKPKAINEVIDYVLGGGKPVEI